MRIKIEKSPYGNEGAIYEGQLGITQHYILQLKSFRDPNKTKEASDYLEADIAGYQEIVDSKSEENALNFLRIKHDAQMAGKRFENNLKVVEYMKETGVWK